MITQAIPNLITFDEFLDGKPENGCYELHNTERVQSVVFPELNLTAKQILNAG
jgi:Uma2 family endonuclease